MRVAAANDSIRRSEESRTPDCVTMGDREGELTTPAHTDTVRVEDLLRNCHVLLNELEAFRSFLVQRKKEHTVEIRQFRNSIQSELKSLEKVRSLPSYHARWQQTADLDSFTVMQRRSHGRPHNPHAPVLEPTFLQRRLDRSET